jgi:glycosyl transferase family 87
MRAEHVHSAATAGDLKTGMAERGSKPFWPRELALGLLPLLIGINVLAWLAYLPLGLRGLADFRTLYTSGYMLRTHHGSEIYDDSKLAEYKERVSPLGHVFPQPMDHLAYEAILFAPLSALSYRKALAVFIVLNIGIVSLCCRLLGPFWSVLQERWKALPILLFAAFFPITRTIVQGQDSIMLLALLTGAFLDLKEMKDYRAGMLTGLGLFKLQIVLPIAFFFLLWRRWRFVSGFMLSLVVVFASTFLIVGTRGVQQYGDMLLGMSIRLRTNADAMRYSLSPRTMLNLRGLLSALFEGHVPHLLLQGGIIMCSIAVVFMAARCRPSMPLAIVAAALVSYHLNAQDASILMIPLGSLLSSESKVLAALAVAVFVVPFSAIIPVYGYIAAVPLSILFVCMVFANRSDDHDAFAT